MNNRQGGGRRRGRNNNQRPQGGQGRGGDQGNRIDSRARGNAAQLLEKYRNMARDAQMAGDRVMTEYYLQFADHYFRVLSDARSRQEEQRGRNEERDEEREATTTTDEAESEDEFDAIDAIGRAPRHRPQRDGQNRDGREGRDSQNREGREGRDGQNRDRGPRDRQARAEGGDDEGGRGEGNHRRRDGHREGNREGNRDGGRDANGRAHRNGRAPEPSDDHEVIGIDVAVLPPAIGIEPVVVAEEAPAEAEAPTPRRRGRPRKVVDNGEAAAEA